MSFVRREEKPAGGEGCGGHVLKKNYLCYTPTSVSGLPVGKRRGTNFPTHMVTDFASLGEVRFSCSCIKTLSREEGIRVPASQGRWRESQGFLFLQMFLSHLTRRTPKKIVTDTPTMTVTAQSDSMNRPSALSCSCRHQAREAWMQKG